jgi:hypothetical protein
LDLLKVNVFSEFKVYKWGSLVTKAERDEFANRQLKAQHAAVAVELKWLTKATITHRQRSGTKPWTKRSGSAVPTYASDEA